MQHPYLEGVHRPVVGERSDADLPVVGRIPDELRGTFARNSGNPRFPPEGRHHWFDGDGMVHGLRFEGGRASYTNRWIRTPGLAAEEAAGHALWRGILEPMDLRNPLGPVKDTANTDLTWWNGRLVATWWLSGMPQELSLPGLETVGPVNFGQLRGGAFNETVAAHPKVDPRTGELVFFGYNIVKRPYYHYGVAGADGTLLRYEAVDLPRAHVPHDIAITERFSILLDLPLGWDTRALAAGKRKIGFDRSLPARFGILPRLGHAADIRWFEAESCYVYHTVVAWEEGDTVHLIGCRIADPIPATIPDSPAMARLDNILLLPLLHAWSFNLITGAVTERCLDDVPSEFPRINDQYQGRRARWSWTPRVAPQDTLAFDAVRKLDLWTGRTETHEWPQGWLSGECVFAPRPGAQDEDDGWLVTILSNPALGKSEAVVLDGKDPSGPAVARVALPWMVPTGFHAEWCPG